MADKNVIDTTLERETRQYIVVNIGNEQYGIDIGFVDNIVRMQKITRVTISITLNMGNNAASSSKVSRKRVSILSIIAATMTISKQVLGISSLLPICIIAKIRFRTLIFLSYGFILNTL